MAKVSVKLVKSTIGRPDRQLRIVKSLGLGYLNAERQFEVSPALEGQIRLVSHLVEVKEL